MKIIKHSYKWLPVSTGNGWGEGGSNPTTLQGITLPYTLSELFDSKFRSLKSNEKHKSDKTK